MVKTVARWSPLGGAAALVLMAGLTAAVSGCSTTGSASEAGLGPEVITPSDVTWSFLPCRQSFSF